MFGADSIINIRNEDVIPSILAPIKDIDVIFASLNKFTNY